ncbi:MAG: aldehyde ferredoxin oxidoreductase family protein [candidate division Zixibacteria bacterium]|nr:aldehyde ferredoxin oxidoreductase family protein [candidate division Zixibacteria bacterium]
MTHGWAGHILRVDLSRGTATKEPLRLDWAEEYIGGRGLAARYLYEEMDPSVDALGPDNKLIMATGPLTGTNASCGSRYMVVTKGPLTGAITTSNSGGHWGPELKFAGYDMVIVEGRADRPCYLLVDDDRVEIRDAAGVWGKVVSETEDAIRDETGMPELRVAGIGPAGENLVRFACIVNDKHRAAGRSGVGAVMGSKNLKAIAVRGNQGVRIARPRDYMSAIWSYHEHLAESPGRQGLTELGTAPTVDLVNTFGGLPTRNFTAGQFEGTEAINGESIKDNWLVANKACFACNIACGRVTQVSPNADKYMVNMHPRNWKVAGEGPEYENLWSLGADCGVDDMDAIVMANYLCNDLGMDPISMGATLATAMEMYERGLLSDEQTGMALRFGDGKALVAMTEATGFREGFGDELAEGSKRMTEKFEHPEYFMGVKGQEFPAYDPRGFQGMGVAYATCNRGACHLRAWTPGIETSGEYDPHGTDGKSVWVAEEQNRTTAHDATGICMFTTAGAPLDDLIPVLSAATGVDYTMDDFVHIGERIWNIERLWNLKAGLTAADDTLPKRLMEEAHKEGPSAGVTVDLDAMLPDYYAARGWTADGRPTREKLMELGLA